MRYEAKTKAQLISKIKELGLAYDKLQQLFQMIPIGLVVTDNTGNITMTNNFAECIFDKYQQPKKLLDILQREKNQRKVEVAIPSGNKELITAVISSPISAEEQSSMGKIIIIQDITKQKMLEKERDQLIEELSNKNRILEKQRQSLEVLVKERTKKLTEANNQLNSLLESIQDCFFTLDKEFRFTYVNNQLQKRYPQEELLGKYLWEVFPEVKDSGFYHQLLAGTEQAVQDFDVYSNKNYWQFRFYPHDDGVAVLAKDITDKVKYEKEMSRLAGLDLIGQMAASISHEVRNPMTTVRGFLQMLSEKEECLAYSNYFTLMIEELDRANAIITEYLSLGRNEPSELTKQDLNTIVRALIPLIQADALGQDKYLETDLQDLPELLLNSKEIRQIILNLCRNGLEAMPRGKCLRIKTYREDDFAILAIQDQGTGIKPEVLKKLGSPFFTTKPQGNGLGLTICYNIAERHQAKIEVTTGNTGTTFRVKFKVN